MGRLNALASAGVAAGASRGRARPPGHEPAMRDTVLYPGDQRRSDRRVALGLLALLVGLSALRIVYILLAPIELSGDEAYYWDWSRRPDWCYYSKGPVVAWCIWLGRLVCGETVLAVRGPAVLLALASAWMVYLLGKRLLDARTAARAAVLMTLTPLFAAFAFGMTIDPPLLLCWTAGLWLLHRAATGNAWYDWLGLGLAVGLGLLAKYTMGLFYPCALLWLLTDRTRRARLRQPWPWLAVAVSLAGLIPIVLWNARHGWVHFAHNFTHVRGAQRGGLRPMMLLEFVGSQLGVISPVLLVMMLIAVIRRRRQDAMLLWFSVLPLGVFLIRSLRGPVQGNWALVGYVTGFLAFSAAFLTPYRALGRWTRRWVMSALIVAGGMTLLLHVVFVPALAGVPVKYDPLKRLSGAAGLADEVHRLRGRLGEKHFVLTTDRMLAARLAFYLPDHPRTYQVQIGGEVSSQYHLWPGYQTLRHYDAILVLPDFGPNPTLPVLLARQFTPHERRGYVMRNLGGREIQTYSIWLCRDYQGSPPRPEP